MTKKQVKELQKNTPEFYKILEEMAKRVGCDNIASTLLFNNWYIKYSWSSKEEDLFKSWLIKELEVNKALQKEMERETNRSFKSLAIRTKFVNSWIFNYGWTLKEK